MNKNYNIIDFVSLKVICWKPDVLKLVRCVCEWFFAFHSKNNVVCCRLNMWSSAEILNLLSGHVINWNYLTYLMTLFLIALHFWKQPIKLLIIDSVSLNVICWKQTAMKLVRTVWSCWVKSIHHSFVGWTGIERSCPQRSSSPRRIGLRAVVRRKPTAADGFPEKSAWGETPLHFAAHNGHVAAAELLLSKGAAVDAKNKFGRGLNPRSRRQKSRSRTWGTSKYFFVLEILRNMFAFSVNPKHAKNVGINDHM